MTNEQPKSLNGFTGTEQYYFNPFFKNINYTDGVKFVSDNKASWLITDILAVLSHEPSVLKEYNDGEFISIKVLFNGDKATAIYTDGNEKVLFSQKYEYTDFLKYFLIGKNELIFFYTNGVLMLGGEY